MKRGESRTSSPETGRVERITPSGAGLVRTDRGVVFVPLTAPGDLVTFVRRAPHKPDGRLVDVREPGPDRVDPACPAFSVCGGCDLMQLSRDAQLEAHARIVHELLAPIGLADVPEKVAVDPPFGYRTRIRLHARARGKRVELGYFGRGSHEVVDRDACAVTDPRLYAVTNTVRAWLSGSTVECDVALGLQTTGAGEPRPVVALAVRGDPSPAFFGAIADAHASGAVAGVAVRLENTARPMITGDPRPAQLANDGAPLFFPPFGFAQSSDAGARALARSVAELAASDAKHVVELYAGSGTLSVELARGAASFVAIEEDADAVSCAKESFAVRGLAGKHVVAAAESARISPKTDVVVLDPPRRGAAAAIDPIVKARPRRIVYVSCDPSTLARDARALAAAGFVPTRAAVVELFPQTSHVETIARFEPASRA